MTGASTRRTDATSMPGGGPTGITLWGWNVLLVIASLLVLNGIGLYAFIVETQVEGTIGVLLAGFGALSLAVSLEGRRGARWAWGASWVIVGSLAAIGLHMLRGDRLDLQLTYLGLAGIALLGQLLARPRTGGS
jgi:hypothetical protein